MAAVSARLTATSPLFERIAYFADRMTGYRLGDYASNSGFVRQSSSPFDGFGAVVASGSKPLPIGQALKETALFTVEEARDRISSFIDGTFVQESLEDLIQYLGERFLRLETRIAAGGRIANFLVDTKSNQSVPAAAVDPRLSHSAILADRLRASLRSKIGRDAPADAFDSWQGMMLVLDDAAGGTGYTVSNGIGWYGQIYAVASADREENIALVREARSRGIDLVLPRRQDGPLSNLVTGMPILVRSKSLKGTDVHPGLAHDTLKSEFARLHPERKKLGMSETFSRLDERTRSIPAEDAATVRSASDGRVRKEEKSSNVIFLESFHKKFVRPAKEDFEEDESLGFGGLGGLHGERDLVIRRAETEDRKLYVFDRDLSEEVPIAPSSLPAGRYDRENSSGVREGFVEVGRGGGLKHLDLDGKPVPLRNLSPSTDANRTSETSAIPSYRHK